MTKGETVSIVDSAAPAQRDAREVLVHALDAARPLERPRAIPLARVDRLILGRGATAGVTSQGPRALRLDLVDPAASHVHARLERAADGWVVTDEGSKNGTWLNGERVKRAELGADDVLEVANAFFFVQRGGGATDAASPAMRTFHPGLAADLESFARVARSRVPLLIFGETGTGKDVMAREAHALSGRAGPFVALNCGAVPATLIESELFGVRRGAFTGASADRVGRIVAAEGGTLFLDEIAELPTPSQAALLRVLQDGEVVPLGGAHPVKVDVRVVAATHQDLPARIATGQFRDDLYARLRGHVLTLPPLRERRADLGLLVGTLLPAVAGARAATLTIHRVAARTLLAHDWPHNIRELERTLARAVALTEGTELGVAQLPAEVVAAPPMSLESSEAQRQRLLALMSKHAGNIAAVARAMLTSRSQIRRLLAKHGIDSLMYRGDP